MPAEIFSAYPRIAAKVFQQPWAITPEAYYTIVSRLDAFVQDPQPRLPGPGPGSGHKTAAEIEDGLQGRLAAASRGEDWMVNSQNRRAAIPYNMDRTSMIGQVQAAGIVGKGLSGMEISCGGLCVDQIQAAIMHLAELGARKIALHLNTPGGHCTGVSEFCAWLADFSAADVPVHAFTDTMACSCGYWIAAGCATFTAAPTSDIGCIGVFSYLNDRSGEWEKLGRKAHLLASGKFKGQGAPGIPLSEEFLAHLRGEVETLARTFFAHIISHRGDQISAEARSLGKSPEEFASSIMQGQSWLAGQAPRALHDGFLSSRAAHLTALARS